LIHAFALEPDVVATWGVRENFRFIHDKFGLGTPRALLELPSFSDWKGAVYAAATGLDLSEKDWKRLEEIFRIFSEHRCRRAASVYTDGITWLENAEREYARKEFRGIVATQNPRRHSAVILGDDLGQSKAKLWDCERGATPPRSPEEMAIALFAMMRNCRELHLIDPHFGPEEYRHRTVLQALMDILANDGQYPEIVRVHCKEKSTLTFFEQAAKRMPASLPMGCKIGFVRWKEKHGGEKLHNRYVLTELGGVFLGVGLDEGDAGETDDFILLPRAQYEHRWSQYVNNDGAFELADTPAAVHGTRRAAR
jgi:hypothetical protein